MESHISQVPLTFGIWCYFMSNKCIRWCISNHVSFCGLNSNLCVCPCSYTTCQIVWVQLLTSLPWTDLGSQSADAVILPLFKGGAVSDCGFPAFSNSGRSSAPLKTEFKQRKFKAGTGIMWFWQSMFSNLWSFRPVFYHWQFRFSTTASWWLSLQVDDVLT